MAKFGQIHFISSINNQIRLKQLEIIASIIGMNYEKGN